MPLARSERRPTTHASFVAEAAKREHWTIHRPWHAYRVAWGLPGTAAWLLSLIAPVGVPIAVIVHLSASTSNPWLLAGAVGVVYAFLSADRTVLGAILPTGLLLLVGFPLAFFFHDAQLFAAGMPLASWLLRMIINLSLGAAFVQRVVSVPAVWERVSAERLLSPR